MKVDKRKSKRQLLPNGQNNYSLNQLKAEQRPSNESTALKTFEIQSNPIIRNNKSSENHYDLITDIRSIKQCLENSSSPIKKFEKLQSLVLVNLTLFPIWMQIYRNFFRDYQIRKLLNDKQLCKLLLIMIYSALDAEMAIS